MKHYFDYAAATPMSPTVLEAMLPYFSEVFYNPSALYLDAIKVKQDIQAARSRVAECLGAKASEIIFTAGGTEANNLAINGVLTQYPEANCVVSAIEHDAVLEPAGQYQHKIGPVRSDGRVDVAALEGLIDDKTVLVSIMYANNELGTVQPLAEIAKIIERKKTERKKIGSQLPLYFHTDACQAGNYLQLYVNNLGIDLMTLNGGKIYGPKQSGVLFVKTGVKLTPQIMGGGQERNLRSGTENTAGIIGFAQALQEATDLRASESARLMQLRDDLITRIESAFPDAVINGSREYSLPNNVHVTFKGMDNERLMMELDERGIMVATGSACSASSDEPSHVLTAIGLSDADARSSIRITFGRETDQVAIDALMSALQQLVH